jgi:hypothetical protein
VRRTGVKRWWVAIIGALLVSATSERAQGQTQRSAWDTHDEIMEWVSFPAGGPPEAKGVLKLAEGAREFVRIQWAELPSLPLFMFPQYDFHRLNFAVLGQLPPLTDPQIHNALKLTVRQTMGMDTITGRWIHQGWDIEKGIETTPAFEGYAFPSDTEWHEITLRFSDSAYYDTEKPVSFVLFAVGDSRVTSGDIEARYAAMPSGAYLDLDRIEFVHIEETVPGPRITRISPTRGGLYSDVTIEGTNFAVPASRNLVYFGSEVGPAEIVSGTSTSLKVKVNESVGSASHVIVRTPGGKRAVSADVFLVLGPPAKVLIVAGADQTGRVGSQLAPMTVKVVDDNENGLGGQKVSFRLAAGAGSLSAGEVTTDENGLASTVLTLPGGPGVVRVEAKVYGLSPRVFIATATP